MDSQRLTSLPLRSLTRDLTDVLKTVQTAMLKYFTLLSRMPHIQPGALRQPPVDGWPSVNTEKLQAMGKTNEAIEFLRHLPCLVHDPEYNSHGHPHISRETDSIYFCSGEAIDGWEEKDLLTPGHVIWWGRAWTRGGHYLLLDTIKGNITEVGFISGRTTIGYQKYESLPPSEKWTAWPTMSAQAWFEREHRRLERLVYMPVPSHGDEVDYFNRAVGSEREAELIAYGKNLPAIEALLDDEDDADYVQNDSDDPENCDGAESSSDEDDEDIPVEEVEDLQKDDAGLHLTAVPMEGAEPSPDSESGIHSLPILGGSPMLIAEMSKPINVQVFNIYQSNGWPSGAFNRKQCKEQLVQWHHNWSASLKRKRNDGDEKAMLFIRHKLQRGFLTLGQAPRESEMKEMTGLFTQLELSCENMETEILKHTKIHRILEGIVKLGSIPNDDLYHFKKRSSSLLEKWGL